MIVWFKLKELHKLLISSKHTLIYRRYIQVIYKYIE